MSPLIVPGSHPSDNVLSAFDFGMAFADGVTVATSSAPPSWWVGACGPLASAEQANSPDCHIRRSFSRQELTPVPPFSGGSSPLTCFVSST